MVNEHRLIPNSRSSHIESSILSHIAISSSWVRVPHSAQNFYEISIIFIEIKEINGRSSLPFDRNVDKG